MMTMIPVYTSRRWTAVTARTAAASPHTANTIQAPVSVQGYAMTFAW
jgi:hypothetical protein